MYNCSPPDSGESVCLSLQPPGQLACFYPPLPTFCHLSPSVHSPLRSVRKRVFDFQEPCPHRANVFLIFKSLARLGQTCFNFILPLPAPGKPVFISNCLCQPWASLFYFHFALARAGQAVYFFNSLLPALGKPVSISS